MSGLDVGCGANLVYCLLGAKVNKWKMTGLDITEEARQGAQKNLEANPGLARMIDIVINMKPPGNPTQGDYKLHYFVAACNGETSWVVCNTIWSRCTCMYEAHFDSQNYVPRFANECNGGGYRSLQYYRERSSFSLLAPLMYAEQRVWWKTWGFHSKVCLVLPFSPLQNLELQNSQQNKSVRDAQLTSTVTVLLAL